MNREFVLNILPNILFVKSLHGPQLTSIGLFKSRTAAAIVSNLWPIPQQVMSIRLGVALAISFDRMRGSSATDTGG
jgi:hypothetical protein